MATNPFTKDEQGIKDNSSGGIDVKTDNHVTNPTDVRAVQVPPRVLENATALDAYQGADTADLDDAVLIDQDYKVGDETGEFDTTGPVVAFSSPLVTTTDTTPTFTVTADDAGSTLEFKVDNGAWVTGTSPYTTPTLSLAAHTISVRGKNDDEVVGEPVSHAFTVTA